MISGYATTLYFAALVASILIRIPHDRRSAATKVKESRKGGREIALLALVAVTGLLLPLAYAATPWLGFADYVLPAPGFALGGVVTLAWLWLFHRSHADLGRNWSVTLEVRESHELVSHGVYARIRHPMYAALFLHAIAQALLIPNLIAGPAMLVGFGCMFALRVGPEERMLVDAFGDAYRRYQAETKRIIPGVW